MPSSTRPARPRCTGRRSPASRTPPATGKATSRHHGGRRGAAILITAAALYGLSKAFEYFDHAIYAASGAIVSGHTLKHLAAAAACYALLRYIRQRPPLAPPAGHPRTALDAA